MSTRKQTNANKKAAVKAENAVADALEAAKQRMEAAAARKEVTAEDLIRERDSRGLSWKQVAVNLSLGSPSAARNAYTKLTGKHHSTSNPVTKRATSKPGGVTHRKTEEVVWDDDTDQDHLIERLTHVNLRIVRSFRGIDIPEEWVHVARIIRFEYEGEDEALVVHVYTKEACKCNTKPQDVDTGVARCFRIRDIKEVA